MPVGLPKATARVDSRLKLTFAQLVSKSTHHGLWTPLVAVDQKANPAYQGFYNGGGSRRRCMARDSGGRKSPRGVQGKSPVGVLVDEVPQKLKHNVKLVYNF